MKKEIEIKVGDMIFLTLGGATSEYKGHDVKFCTTAGGQPVLYYKGRTATIDLQELANNMLNAILETPEE